MVSLRQWQIEFLEFVKNLPEKSIVNLYDNGKSQGKSFLANYIKDFFVIENPYENLDIIEEVLKDNVIIYDSENPKMVNKAILISTHKLADKKFNITNYYEVK